TGNYAAAIEYYNQSHELWGELHNPRGQAQALLFLASCHSDLSEIVAASGELSEALSLFTRIDNRKGRAQALIALGNLRSQTADKQEALNAYERAREIVEKSGDIFSEGLLWSGIAYVYSELGDDERALEFFRTALAKYRASDHRPAE